MASLSLAACAVTVVAGNPDDPATGRPAADTNAPPSSALQKPGDDARQSWNWHVQNTDIVDWHPSFPAKYSGPNSLSDRSELQNTVSLDLLAGARLWPGAEFHVDGLMWQGFGFTRTLGIEGFPNGEAFRFGTKVPNVDFTRAFIRQTIGLGGEQEDVADDALHLAGKVDVSRITLTAGKLSVKDVFDGNTYANDPRTQFMNWGLVANEAWDYPADSIGFTTGFTVELNEPQWTARYGFFQVPRVSNGLAEDPEYLRAWGMVAEFERRFSMAGHPGVIRVLAFLNEAHMGSYEEVVDNPDLHGDLSSTRDYRKKYGFGLNLEQELTKGLGAFARAGWSDGQTEAWAFSDVDRALSTGLSLNGQFWHRPQDTIGVAGIANGISRIHQEFLEDGGTGILAGDGQLNYGWEEIAETYYDFEIFKGVHGAVDYQFVSNPAFNRDRGPVSVFSARLHWEF